MSDLFAIPGVRFEERYVPTGLGASLRVLQWSPENPTLDWPLVLVPGWASIPEGWEDLLRVAAQRQPLYYVETREKVSARFTRPERPRDFAIDHCCDDLVRVCGALGPPLEEQVIVAASLGATLFLHLMKHGRFAPRGLFAISPTGTFAFPWWGGAITYVPSLAFPPAIAFVLLYLRHFRVDSRNEPQQYARYDRALRSAHPTRMRYSARMFRGFELWDDLDTVTGRVRVAHAVSDTLHEPGDIRRIMEATGASELRAPSDLYLHCSDVLPDIDDFVATLQDA